MEVYRGDVWLVDLGERFHSEQGGLRPCLVVQNDTGNKYSPTTIVLPITTQKKKYTFTHVPIQLERLSNILCEQIMVIDKSRMLKKIAGVGAETMNAVEEKMRISLGMRG